MKIVEYYILIGLAFFIAVFLSGIISNNPLVGLEIGGVMFAACLLFGALTWLREWIKSRLK